MYQKFKELWAEIKRLEEKLSVAKLLAKAGESADESPDSIQEQLDTTRNELVLFIELYKDRMAEADLKEVRALMPSVMRARRMHKKSNYFPASSLRPGERQWVMRH